MCYLKHRLRIFLFRRKIVPFSRYSNFLIFNHPMIYQICDIRMSIQAWQERKRQACGHHSPSSIQEEWLAKDDQKNNILASLCLASYLAGDWLQKLETKQCLLRRTYFCSYVCVCVCMVSQFDLSITKQNYLFVRYQSLSIYLTLCHVQISHYRS